MRLQAVRKLGFYPLPPEIVTLIAARLKADPQSVVIDPCAGEGAALWKLREALNIPQNRTFAIELDEGRSATIADRYPLIRLLPSTSFLATAITSGCVSLCLTNSPFDDELGGGRREEMSFLAASTRVLRPGGVLVFVLPQRIACRDDICRHLDSWYDEVQPFHFPEEHRRYNEVVIFGRRRKHTVAPAGGAMSKTRYESWKWPTLSDEIVGSRIPPGEIRALTIRRPAGDRKVWTVPAGEVPRRFEKIGYVEPELIRELNASPIVPAIFGEPAEPEVRQPGLPVRHGQVILTLVSGRLDGVVRRDSEPPHVIRGTAEKVPFTKEEEDLVNEKGDITGHRTVIAEDARLTIRAVWPDFLRIYDFSSSTSGATP